MAKRAKTGEPLRYLKEDVLTHTGTDCLTWPHSRCGGYGNLRFNGRMIHAHRLVCILAHGEPPSPKHEAAHECGKGHEGCVNPNHLSWKTAAENKADMVRHGTYRNGRTRLSISDVLTIRSMSNAVSTAEIARLYDVNWSTIKYIRIRRTWPHIGRAAA